MVQTGGGFIGGGFGAAGMIEGMAVAGALNALTKETKINNVGAILARENALGLHNSLFNPASLEMAFVPIKSATAQAAARRVAEPIPAPPAQLSRYDQLKQLAEPRAMGALTDRRVRVGEGEGSWTGIALACLTGRLLNGRRTR